MILINGASGKTGKAILQELILAGESVRAFVHSADQVDEIRSLGANEVVWGDLREPESAMKAVRGVDSIYHICPNMDPDELKIGRVFIAAAKHHKVSNFIYHSVLHPQVPEMQHHWNKLQVEQELFTSGLSYSIVQPAVYMQNILAYWPVIRSEGVYAPPYSPQTRLGLVHLADFTAAAVKIIQQPEFRGGIFELVGTPPYSQVEVAEMISARLGIPIQTSTQSRISWEENARRNKLPEYSIRTLLAMFEYYEEYGMGGSPYVLESILGRKATDFTQFVDQQLAT